MEQSELTPEQIVYSNETYRRIKIHQQAQRHISFAINELSDVRSSLFRLNHSDTRHKSLSMAITNIEQASLWLTSVSYTCDPRIDTHPLAIVRESDFQTEAEKYEIRDSYLPSPNAETRDLEDRLRKDTGVS